jgi:hypothetical protein
MQRGGRAYFRADELEVLVDENVMRPVHGNDLDVVIAVALQHAPRPRRYCVAAPNPL